MTFPATRPLDSPLDPHPTYGTNHLSFATSYSSPWVPACGGTEAPFTVNGRRLLYCWQPSTGRHAYMDLGTDMILSDEEARAVLGY